MKNEYRKVRYTDDGCTIYECLKCKVSFEVRSIDFIFCSHCGTKWDGELKWDEDAKYEREKLGQGSNIYRIKDIPMWQMQLKVDMCGDPLWEDDGYPFKHSALGASVWLRQRRHEFRGSNIQARLILQPSAKLPLP